MFIMFMVTKHVRNSLMWMYVCDIKNNVSFCICLCVGTSHIRPLRHILALPQNSYNCSNTSLVYKIMDFHTRIIPINVTYLFNESHNNRHCGMIVVARWDYDNTATATHTNILYAIKLVSC